MWGSEGSPATEGTNALTTSERTPLVVLKRHSKNRWQEKIGLFEPTKLNFWRLVFGEFIYTLLFTIVACGCTLSVEKTELHRAICVGQLLFVLFTISADGFGYFNPALSFGLLIARRISCVRFFVYAIVQIAGGCAGAGLLYLYMPERVRGHLGTLSVHPEMSSGVAFLIELTLTFIVMMAVMATTDPLGNLGSKVQSSVVVAMSFTAVILMDNSFSGAGINPVRAFAPAAITGSLVHQHWVYWVGPLVGALLAALSYEFVFKLSPEPQHRQSNTPTVQLNTKDTSNSSV